MLTLLLAVGLGASQVAADTSYLYRTLLLRAAPGELQQVVSMYLARRPVLEAGGDPAPFVLQHRQGDQWDLMLLFPMGSFEAYYASDNVERRRRAAEASGLSGPAFAADVAARISWREETFVLGPSLDMVRREMEGGALYHVEMFLALPGKRSELFQQRQMENVYLAAIDRPRNMIFTRAGGGSWDLYTLGVHADFPAFAAGDTISAERERAAALAAGFEGVSAIGPYLRSLIQYHHDTLARPVR